MKTTQLYKSLLMMGSIVTLFAIIQPSFSQQSTPAATESKSIIDGRILDVKADVDSWQCQEDCSNAQDCTNKSQLGKYQRTDEDKKKPGPILCNQARNSSITQCLDMDFKKKVTLYAWKDFCAAKFMGLARLYSNREKAPNDPPTQ